MGVINRRSKNLGDMLLFRKKFALSNNSSNHGTINCKKSAQKRQAGRPCGSCSLMSGKNTVQSKVSGKVFNTPAGDCKSRNVVYLAQCKRCGKQYVGKTCTCMRKRICGHRAYVGEENCSESDESALAEHIQKDHNLNSVDQFNEAYHFTILDSFPHNMDQ